MGGGLANPTVDRGVLERVFEHTHQCIEQIKEYKVIFFESLKEFGEIQNLITINELGLLFL